MDKYHIRAFKKAKRYGTSRETRWRTKDFLKADHFLTHEIGYQTKSF
jgi:hypothetical protein